MNETKYPYSKASKAATYIAELLRPHCTRLHIAGSIRRMRPDVKDIEIVCEPKKIIRSTDMFGGTEEIPSHEFATALHQITESIIKGKIRGRYMQIKTISKLCPGIYLDLFMPQPDDYFRQYAIRTGSAEYAHHVIAAAWKRKGWVGVKEIGLRKYNECDHQTDTHNKTTHTLKKNPGTITLPPVWNSEGEFFTWLSLPYTDPEYRNFKPLNEAQ